MLLKYLPAGYDELYVEFWIQFGPNWPREYIHPSATHKMFRISSWSGEGSEYGAFSDGNIGPIALWDYTINGYGARNRLAFRGGPHSDNYGLGNDAVPDISEFTSGSVGDLNLNFTGHLATRGPGGTQPVIEDRVNGGFITKDTSGLVSHDQIWGPGDAWTKLGFYVKMNSAVNATDGVFKQYLNDHQIYQSVTLPWIRSSATRDENAKWNLVAIGGNDFFQNFGNYEMKESWYQIDDLVIRDSLPQELL